MKRVPPPRVGADRAAHLVEVAPVAGREVVEADDVLVEREQRLDQVRADEAGAPVTSQRRGAARSRALRRVVALPAPIAMRLVSAHHSLQTSMPRCAQRGRVDLRT